MYLQNCTLDKCKQRLEGEKNERKKAWDFKANNSAKERASLAVPLKATVKLGPCIAEFGRTIWFHITSR